MQSSFVTDTMFPDDPHWPDVLLAEQLTFGLLGKALYRCEDRGWLSSLLLEDLFGEIPFGGRQSETREGRDILLSWCLQFAEGLSDERFDELRHDFTRLMVVPGPAFSPPWESVYFNDEQLTFQDQTVQVRAWYRFFGLEPEKLHQEPDDHISLELLFVGHCAGLARCALEEGDRKAFQDMLSAQRSFLEEHLLTWAPAWCHRVAAQAHTLFYRGIALLAAGALRELAEILGAEKKME